MSVRSTGPRAPTETELHRRGAATLVASWEAYAKGAAGAWVERAPDADIAVFPEAPERAVYNNAFLGAQLTAGRRADAVDLVESTYASAGIERFAVWVHESDEGMRRHLARRGYTLDSSTRAMARTLQDLALPRPEIELGPADWPEHLRIAGVPPGFLAGADPGAYHVLIARLGNDNVATAMAFDHDGDCGIYNTGTLNGARRRGIATALVVFHLHDALARGCTTASLQSTPMAERLYAAVGFEDLGRILEYVPVSGLRGRVTS